MKLRLLMIGFLLTAGVFSSAAQEAVFGKNKVKYKKFEWWYIQTNHFDIYFSDNGEYLANFTAAAAESAYTLISKSFHYEINNRIPIMVYNSHNDFQQTNVLSEYMEEGIGGVTELFKNRMVVPFEGSYKQFRHVIHHELVHAVFNDMYYGGSIQSIISNNIRLQLPMWFNEGMAEYQSLHWDTNSDMFMRDATIHTYLPPIEYLGGYFAYRGGQSVWYYITNKYGDQKIAEILNRIKGSRSIELGFKNALGLSISELNERWQKEQKVLYWPDIAKREDPADFATRLTNHVKESDFYNTSPSISPQGDKIAFISDRDDYFDVYIMSTIDNKITKIVDGQRTKNFEELHLLTPGITWSPDGKKIALAVKSGESDAIFIVDAVTGNQEKIQFQLEGIFSVDWSPKGDKLAFVGDDAKQSDIYLYDLATKNLTNLTDDIFSDSDPHWARDGKTIYFVSDRRDNVDRNAVPPNFKMAKYDFSESDIYSLNVETMEMKRIVDYPGSDATSPAISPDGTKMLYVSDRNGIGNIYERNLVTGADRPVTNSLTGVFQLSLSADGNKLSFAALNEAGFDIYLMKAPFDKKLAVSELEPTEYLKRKMRLAQKTTTTPGAQGTKDSSRAATVPPKDTAGVYGDRVHIDFQNYVFSDEQPKEKSPSPEAETAGKQIEPSDNVDEQGNYKVNKYKLNFSPDIIYGNAGYSTFYGVEGTTELAFSDMLGNHQIYLLTNLMLDLENSDYVIAYNYLATKIDYGIIGFHSARFLYLYDQLGNVDLYRFQTWGIGWSASYPLDKFNRIDFTLAWLNISRQNLDYPTLDEPTDERNLVMPEISYIHDTSLWGITSPNNGTRYNFTAMFSPALASGGHSLDFQTYTLDYRTYEKFWRDYSFVIRWAGGLSMGRDPQRFFIGGTDGWINREFANGGIPINNVEDYAFLSPALPLRGFDYNDANGTKYALMNYELRFPLIRYLVTGGLPLALQNITGALFVDVGSSWTDDKAYRFFVKDADGSYVAQDLLMGTGYGVRMIFFGLPLKLDVAWAFNGQTFSIPIFYVSLAEDF